MKVGLQASLAKLMHHDCAIHAARDEHGYAALYRFIVHNSIVTISSLRNEKEMQEISKQNDNIAREYLEKNKDKSPNQLIVTEAIKRWIDIDFAILAFSDLAKKYQNKEFETALENAFTEFDRIVWSFEFSREMKNWKYIDELALYVLVSSCSNNWKDKAKEYWISSQSIEKANEDYIEGYYTIDDWKYRNEVLLQDKEFREKLEQVASRIWTHPDNLIAVMRAESWLNPRAVNRNSWATWLIQFMPATARNLWTSVWKLRNMSAVEQLTYVEKYFSPYKKYWLNSVHKLYMATFYPAAFGKSKDFVFWSESGIAKAVASQNPAIRRFSTRADKLIDWYAFEKYCQNKA